MPTWPASIARGRRFASPHLLLLILVWHLGVSLSYSLTLPILEGEDESLHFDYVRFLIREQRLPRGSDDTGESHQPPLSYFLIALFTFWVPDQTRPELNDFWAYDTFRPGVDNKNLYLHSPAEAFPYTDTTLAVRLGRLFSTVCGLGVVIGVFATTRVAFPERPGLALGAAAFTASLPAFLASVSGISNDPLGACLGASLIYLTTRGVQHRFTLRDTWLIGVLGGLLLINKITTAFVLLPTGWALLSVQPERRPAKRHLIAASLPLIGLPLLWVMRNYLVYGQPVSAEVNKVLQFSLEAWPATAWQLWSGFERFWIHFGVGQISATPTVYLGLAGVTVMSVMGLGRWWRLASAAERKIIGLWLAYVGLAMLGMTFAAAMHRFGPLPRVFFFPVLPALAPMLVLGWLALDPQTEQHDLRNAGLIGLAMSALAGYALFGILRPAFTAPRLSPATEWPVPPFASPVQFGEAVELIGAQVEPQRVARGDEVTVTLCWRAFGPTPNQLIEFVHLIAPDQLKIGERQTYPGLGRLPSRYWSAGDRFCDVVHLRVTAWAGGPARLPVLVGFFSRGQGTLPATVNQHTLDGVSVGEVSIAAQTPPDLQMLTPWPATFGAEIELLGYQLLPPTAPDTEYQLRLFWRALSPPTLDYTVFVHWLTEPTGGLLAQSDAMPRQSLYPTSAWEVGEIVVDDHLLPLPTSSSGPTRFEIGLYDLNSGQRLPPAGGSVANLAVVLTGPTLPTLQNP